MIFEWSLIKKRFKAHPVRNHSCFSLELSLMWDCHWRPGSFWCFLFVFLFVWGGFLPFFFVFGFFLVVFCAWHDLFRVGKKLREAGVALWISIASLLAFFWLQKDDKNIASRSLHHRLAPVGVLGKKLRLFNLFFSGNLAEFKGAVLLNQHGQRG